MGYRRLRVVERLLLVMLPFAALPVGVLAVSKLVTDLSPHHLTVATATPAAGPGEPSSVVTAQVRETGLNDEVRVAGAAAVGDVVEVTGPSGALRQVTPPGERLRALGSAAGIPALWLLLALRSAALVRGMPRRR